MEAEDPPSDGVEPHNIVILGGSFAGIAVAQGFLRKIVHELGRTRTAPRYRVILISPSTHLYWNIGAPRALVAPDLIPHSKAFISILDAFEDYPRSRFKFIHGSAFSVDFRQRNVTISLCASRTRSVGRVSTTLVPNPNPARWSHASRVTSATTASMSNRESLRTIPYHALIIATGSSAESPLLSLHGPHEETQVALNGFHSGLRDASSVIIAGGGPSGIECAGQLATYYNRKRQQETSKKQDVRGAPKGKANGAPIEPDFLSHVRSDSSQRPTAARQAPCRTPKSITLISGNERLLPKLPVAVGEKAEAQLRGLGVHIMHSVRVIAALEMPSGVTRCTLSNDLTISSDLYIAATGVKPNTSFLPAELLDASGYVLSDPRYLRLDRGGARVYALGDCAAHSKNTILDVYETLPVLLHNLRNDLWEFELKRQNPYGGGGVEDAIAALQDMEYTRNPKNTQLVPITRWGGVGILFDIKLPSFAVWAMKGRDYRVGKAKKVVKKGKDPYADPA